VLTPYPQYPVDDEDDDDDDEDEDEDEDDNADADDDKAIDLHVLVLGRVSNWTFFFKCASNSVFSVERSCPCLYII
jgi:hypothetical protein